jgi:predicted dehydrogenase
MKVYRVAVIGCRSRGPAAALAYDAHPRAKVVGVCDLQPELARELAGKLRAALPFTDMDEMLQSTEPDIVAIATGTEFHFPLAMRALEYGVHLDIEKPMCVDLTQADALIARAQEKDAQIAVHHQQRTAPAFRAVADAIAKGRIGEPRYLLASDKGYYGGYGLMNIGTHLINGLLDLAGHCKRVSAVALTGGRVITPEDAVISPGGMGIIAGEHITATLQFGGNLTASVLLHRFPKVDKTAYGIEVFGTSGRLFWTSKASWWLPNPHFTPRANTNQWEELSPRVPAHYSPACGADLADYCYADDFIQALDENRAHTCSGSEGHHVLEVMMSIFAAGAYGKTVDLPLPCREHPLLRWRREAGLADPAPKPRDYAEWLTQEDQRIQGFRA